MKSFTAAQVSAFRLARHHLSGVHRSSLVSVCRDVGGIQAQVMSAAELSLWTRRRETRHANVQAALWQRRELVKTTCMRVDQWLPAQKSVDVADAHAELATRFLTAFGPATPHDFAKWSGLKMSDAKPVFDALAGAIEPVTVDGATCWMLRRDLVELADSTPDPAPRLLPAFDTFLLAHAAKHHLIEPRFYKRVYRAQGWISPVVIVSGRVVAVWFLEERTRAFTVDVRPFARLDTRIRLGIEQEAEALGQFLGACCMPQFT